MIKRIISAVVAIALGFALSLAGATGAQARVIDGGSGGGGGTPLTPVHSESIDCSTAAVSLTDYDQAATATVILDGVTEHTGTFNRNYTATWPLTSDATHTSHQLQVTVVTTYSPYDVTYDHTASGCYTAPPVVDSLPLTFETVVWSMPSPNTGTSATYPQVGVAQYKGETTQTLDVAVPSTCGTQYQVDVYLQTNGTVDNTAAIDAMFAAGLAGPNGAQDGSYLAGQSGNPGVSGLNHAWKFVKNADCSTAVDCVVNTAIPWAAETDTGDLPPTVGPDGLEFKGPHTVAMDYYQRVTAGNMQGLTGMTVTYAAGGSGYQALVVVEVDPNVDLNATPGINHYATISSVLGAGDTSGTFNVQDGLWYTSKIAPGSPGGQGHPISWAAMTALMPDNTLLSAPSLHQQTQTGADALSVVTSLSSSCGSTNFVPRLIDVAVLGDPTKTDQLCTETGLTGGVITVVITPHVSYEITDSANAVVPFDATTGKTGPLAPGDYTVSVTADTGYHLTSAASYSLSIAPYTGPCKGLPTDATVDPSALQQQIGCKTDGSYTLSSDQEDPTAVIWTVNGSVVSQGTYLVSGAATFHITAAPRTPDFGFDGESQLITWDFTFGVPSTCDLTTLALTGTDDGMPMLAASAMLMLLGVALVRSGLRIRRRNAAS
jgi:hypothetical protein